MTTPGVIYKLQIVHAEDGAVATFQGRGAVERDLIAAISRQAGDLVPALVTALQARGRWWLMPGHFDTAMTDAVREALPAVLSRALDAVLWDVKTEASAKHGA